MEAETARELYVWEKNHIEVCKELNLFEGKDVLEVGGTTPEYVSEQLNTKSWTCIDPWVGVNASNDNYKIISADIATLDLPDHSFDLIISTNAFEHIHNLKKGLKNMKRMLRPGGYLSALLGPIWSCAKGHHLWVYDEAGKIYSFNDDTLPQWSHLLFSEQEMRTYLTQKFSQVMVDEIMKDIYSKAIINHMFYDDYIELIEGLGLEVVELRDWHKPIVPDKETQQQLVEKWGKKNFSTVSIKILLKA